MREDSSGYVRLSEKLRESISQSDSDSIGCEHLGQVKDVKPSAGGCEDCLKTGDEWVYLRLCLTCGHVGCCDNSKNKHATRHFHDTGHPVIASYEPGEKWLWCYTDEMGFEGDF